MVQFDHERNAKKVAPEIETLIASCSSGDPQGGRMRSVMETIIQKLIDADLAFREQVRPELVGVHPKNRHGVGCIPSEVHSPLLLIVQQGWANVEVAGKAIAFQHPPGVAGKLNLTFNQELVEKSNGLLAPISSDMRIVTVVGTHTSQALKAVNAGVKGVPTIESTSAANRKRDVRIWDERGHVDKQKVLTVNPVMQAVLQHGLEYVVIRQEMEKVALG